ncbi:hypothetical protein SLEP1_g33426 [Rubroshorea leprosula]|uniref:TF-B3 domain-containing protein n=1 Tax=Rubroshorea leprosula TaxID=152421 RepID=A0AAV5KGK1_9ROSI|nr:hypothetical protein SLEP1_g33426 [Rubroshorea leprosula]
MGRIFEKTVDQTDIGKKKLKLPRGTKFEEPQIVVRDETDETNTQWNFQLTKSAGGQSYLGGQGWEDFVSSKGIGDGSWIGLYKEKDHLNPEAPPYKIVFRN